MHNYIHVHIELGCLHASTPVYIFCVAMVTTPAPKRPWVRIETTVFCCYGAPKRPWVLYWENCILLLWWQHLHPNGLGFILRQLYSVAMVHPNGLGFRIERTVFCCYGDNTCTQTALGFVLRELYSVAMETTPAPKWPWVSYWDNCILLLWWQHLHPNGLRFHVWCSTTTVCFCLHLGFVSLFLGALAPPRLHCLQRHVPRQHSKQWGEWVSLGKRLGFVALNDVIWYKLITVQS